MEDITVGELSTRLQNGEKPNIIDVRELYEHQEFNIEATLQLFRPLFLLKFRNWKEEKMKNSLFIAEVEIEVVWPNI